jgi:PKD repeat protein
VNFQSSDTSFCGKQCIDFTDLSTNNPVSWQWLFPGADSTSSNMQNPVGICYSSFGSFDVTLIACNVNGCDTLTVPGFINEYQNPPVPTVTYSADTLYSSAAWSYQWYYNSVLIPGATSQYYVFQQMGNYFVIVTDSNGCASSSSTLVLSTGINESEHPAFSVFPNPSDGNLILSGAPIHSTINVFDITGRTVFSDFVRTNEMHLQIEAASGIYLLEVIIRDQAFRTKIIVKN